VLVVEVSSTSTMSVVFHVVDVTPSVNKFEAALATVVVPIPAVCRQKQGRS